VARHTREIRFVRVRFLSWRVLIIVVVGVTALGFVAPQLWAWYHLRAARVDLARYHPEQARKRLESCLRVWSSRAEVHRLASRAARQSGDLEAAAQHLRTCQRLQSRTSKDVALEWALLNAASGNLREVEEFLQRHAEEEPEDAPLIWEAVAEGYIRVYRVLDALSCLDNWLKIDPNNIRALELRGMNYHNAKQTRKAAEDFRRVIEMDPTREATRWRLALCLLDSGAYEDALTQLHYFQRIRPNDPDVEVRLARCAYVLGRNEQARQILDAVLAKHPDHALSLRTRGQFAIVDRQPEQAEKWLRRAVTLAPNDYQAQLLLHQSLQQQNKTEEAEAQLRIAEEAREQAERLGDLTTRRLYQHPLDPALHVEMGVLLLRTGRKSAAEGWLLSALRLNPDYQPAHAALADYYAEQGDANRAAEHRRRAIDRSDRSP
jgi:tetratricopeptide (TPR) repeat protein